MDSIILCCSLRLLPVITRALLQSSPVSRPRRLPGLRTAPQLHAWASIRHMPAYAVALPPCRDAVTRWLVRYAHGQGRFDYTLPPFASAQAACHRRERNVNNSLHAATTRHGLCAVYLADKGTLRLYLFHHDFL